VNLFQTFGNQFEGLTEADFESPLKLFVDGQADLFEFFFGVGANFEREPGDALLEFLALMGKIGLKGTFDPFVAAIYAIETRMETREIRGLRLLSDE
jgi:hypothetical protein